MYLTRDQILNMDDMKTQEVDVPEWGGAVVVKMMTGKERDAFEASLSDGGKNPKVKYDNIRAKLVAMTVIDTDSKKLMFSIGDVEMLGGKSAAALDRVFTVAQKLCGLSKEDVDELVKN